MMEKLCTSKTFLKMGGGKMHTPDPTPLDPLLAINYKNHQKAYFGHLAPLILFIFTERQSQICENKISWATNVVIFI